MIPFFSGILGFRKESASSDGRRMGTYSGPPPRCLEWDSELYRRMGVPEGYAADPPRLDINEIVKFHIGNDRDDSRLSRAPNIAVSIVGGRETLGPVYQDYRHAFQQSTLKFMQRFTMIIGNGEAGSDCRIDCHPFPSVLNLMERLVVKLILNTISTGTMVLMSRVTGNWMTWVDVSNKKLRDRGIRLIAEICNLSYRDACYALHETMEDLKNKIPAGGEKHSPVQFTINQYRAGDRSKD